MFAERLIAMLVLCIAVGAGMAEEREKPVNISGEFEYSCDEVVSLSEAALKGSAEDALKLFWFHLDRGDKDEALYWAQVAMENGSSVGRHNYASLLVERGDVRSVARAKYHLRILADQGNKDAQSLLREIESKSRD